MNKSAGPFDALLCVGQFFPDTPEQLEEFSDYIEGRSKIPIPTYFIGDYGVGAAKILAAAAMDSANLGFKMDGLKVCENLYWLRGSGKFLLHGTPLITPKKLVFFFLFLSYLFFNCSCGDLTLIIFITSLKCVVLVALLTGCVFGIFVVWIILEFVVLF